MARRYLRVSAGSPILRSWRLSFRLHGAKPTSIDAGICGFIANIYFCDIDMPLKKFVVAHDNIVRHCRASRAAVSRPA
jgi:hypothetical protein